MNGPPPGEDDIAFAGVTGQVAMLRAGTVTAEGLLDLSLRRIARLDGQLGAFRTLFETSARAEARAADEALALGDRRPLLGVPVAVKDNVAVAGHAPGHGTGSPEPRAGRDTQVVQRLRAAGAVVVGATRLPELALWPFTESATCGVTRNPWSPAHTPGGSSGGSAAAVAAGLVAAAHATDGGGSIRIPAACTGLVGLKPQRDRVPLDEEHWYGLSHAGCLTRTVADTAVVLSVLAGESLLPTPVGAPLRIAWSTAASRPVRMHPEVMAALTATLDVLRGLGHEVVHADPSYRGIATSFLTRFARGARQDWLQLADRRATEPRTRLVAALGRLPWHAGGAAATERLAVLPAAADILVTPVMPRPPDRTGRMTGLATLALAGAQVPYTSPWNVTGQPAMSVPAGFTDAGLPLAVQLVGRPREEALLLGLAAQLEAATDWPRHRPRVGP